MQRRVVVALVAVGLCGNVPPPPEMPGPDVKLHERVEAHRPAAAAVGGGPLFVVEFRHKDGRPLDWEPRYVYSWPGHDRPVVPGGRPAALPILGGAVAAALGGFWVVRRGRRIRG